MTENGLSHARLGFTCQANVYDFFSIAQLGAYGVCRALELIYNECDITMAFCGHIDIRQVCDDTPVKGRYEQLKSALPYIAPMHW